MQPCGVGFVRERGRVAAFPPSHTFVAYWSLSPRGGSLSAPNMLALSWGLAAAAPTDVVGCVLSVGGCLLSADSHALAAEKPKETKETQAKVKKKRKNRRKIIDRLRVG